MPKSSKRRKAQTTAVRGRGALRMGSGSCGSSENQTQNENAGSTLSAPMNGAPTTWISDPPNSNGMKRTDKKIRSRPVYSNSTLDGNGEAKEDPNTTPSP